MKAMYLRKSKGQESKDRYHVTKVMVWEREKYKHGRDVKFFEEF